VRPSSMATPVTAVGAADAADVALRSQARVDESRWLRMALAVTSLGSLTLGLVGFVWHFDSLRAPALLTFFLLGIGSAPWQRDARMQTYERLVLTFITSSAVTIVGALAMTTTHLWFPGIAFVLAAALCLPLHVHVVSDVWGHARTSGASGWPSRSLPFVPTRVRAAAALSSRSPTTIVALLGALLCLLSALLHRHVQVGFYGFLPNIGLAWYLGLTLILLGIGLTRESKHSAALPVLLLVLVVTLTPALTYDTPRSQSAAKHIEFVLQVLSQHTLDTSVPLYNAYAGFFVGVAWLCDVAGITDPLRFATLWPVALGIVRVVVLRFLAGQFFARPGQCWVAVTIAVLADSIGADYFSPQSLGFVLGMAAIAVALSGALSRYRTVLLCMAGVTLAVTHQLTPFVVSGVLTVLVVFDLCRPRWAPLMTLIPAIIWAGIHYQAVQGFLSLSRFARLDNFRPPVTMRAPGLQRLPVVQETVLALLVGILAVGVMAALALVQRRRDRRYWAIACCPAVGLILVAVNPYGQEGIFRAVLFGLPWLALLASDLVSGDLPASPMLSRVAVLGTTSCLLVAFLMSSFGLDGTNVIRPSDLAAVRHFNDLGGPRPPNLYYMLILNPGDQPTSPEMANTRHFTWSRDLIDEPVTQQAHFDPRAEVRRLTDRLIANTRDIDKQAQLFALWSPAGALYGEAYAIQSLRQSFALRDAFRESPFWSSEPFGDGTYLFQFRRAKYVGLAGGR
jgi:hypothetical protein